MSNCEKEADRIFDKIMDMVDNDGRLSLEAIPIIAQALQTKQDEIERLKVELSQYTSQTVNVVAFHQLEDEIERLRKNWNDSVADNQATTTAIESLTKKLIETERQRQIEEEAVHRFEKRMDDLTARNKKLSEVMVSKHPCGHYVSSIMSFCTVCREIQTLTKKLSEAETFYKLSNAGKQEELRQEIQSLTARNKELEKENERLRWKECGELVSENEELTKKIRELEGNIEDSKKSEKALLETINQQGDEIKELKLERSITASKVDAVYDQFPFVLKKIESLESKIAVAREALESVKRNDKTIYEYFGANARNRDGLLADKGRWNTPREIAGQAIAELEEK